MMDMQTPQLTGQFRIPKKSLRGLKADVAAIAIAAAADIALVIKPDGQIEDVSMMPGMLDEQHADALMGAGFEDTLTVESLDKVKRALKEAADDGHSRSIEVNHTFSDGLELPVRYTFVALEPGKKCLALGRDLSVTARLQRRLVNAQQEMEREYAKLRVAETRYRLLFQQSAEPVVIAEAATLRVLEINPAAEALLQVERSKVMGKSAAGLFGGESGDTLRSLFTVLRTVGTVDGEILELSDQGASVSLSATQFTHGRTSHVLMRLTVVNEDGEAEATQSVPQTRMLQVIESAPEGFVVVDYSGRIVAANTAFAELVQVSSVDVVIGQSIDAWIGRPGAEYELLSGQVKDQGASRFFATSLHGELGETLEVEISGVSVPDGRPPCLGYVIRNVGGRLDSRMMISPALPAAVGQMRELVGRVPLKELVRETTDIVERMCIEAALELTGDNRASAAEMLGLSRQSLYVKLRRYGLDGGGSDDNDAS